MNNARLAAVALKGLLPFPATLRALKRRLVPYVDDPINSACCLDNGLQQIAALRAAGVGLTGDVLEFGTGWLPLIPLLFHLAGARSLTLTDIERLMDAATIARAKRLVAQRIAEVAAVLEQPEAALLARLDAPFAPRYLVPWDASRQKAHSADLILSRAVFEHVPQAALRHVLAAFHRVLRTGGAMCHLVDNSDHWEHHDKTLSRIDFLRYDDRDLRWRIANSNVQSYQNRMRHSDYAALFAATGFTVLHSEGVPDPTCLRDLNTLPLAARFRGHDRADLTILTSLFVVRPRPAA